MRSLSLVFFAVLVALSIQCHSGTVPKASRPPVPPPAPPTAPTTPATPSKPATQATSPTTTSTTSTTTPATTTTTTPEPPKTAAEAADFVFVSGRTIVIPGISEIRLKDLIARYKMEENKYRGLKDIFTTWKNTLMGDEKTNAEMFLSEMEKKFETVLIPGVSKEAQDRLRMTELGIRTIARTQSDFVNHYTTWYNGIDKNSADKKPAAKFGVEMREKWTKFLNPDM